MAYLAAGLEHGGDDVVEKADELEEGVIWHVLQGKLPLAHIPAPKMSRVSVPTEILQQAQQ